MKKNDDFEISEKTHFGPKKSGFGRIFKKIPGIDQKWPKVSKTSKKSKIGGKSHFSEPNHGFSQMAKTSQINEFVDFGELLKKIRSGGRKIQKCQK